VRFLILGLNYLPESTSIGPYTADLAQYLKAASHHVQVITGFPLAPQWCIWEGYRGYWFMREEINAVPLLRTFLYVPSHPKKAFRRILFDLSFALSSLLGGLFTGPADWVVVVSPPLQLGLTGWLLSLVKRAPLFFHIQDLVPDAAVATGMLRENSLAVRLARAVERFVYRRAQSIGVICEGFAENLVAKGVPEDKVVVFPNYLDIDSIRPMERNSDFRRRHGIELEQFLVMYSGSVALKQGLHTFVMAASKLQQQKNIVFCLIGEGPYLDDLKSLASELCVNNIRFLPLQPREQLAEQLAAADLLVITQRRSVTDIVFPGKLLYYMAAGRPILAAVNSNSETGRFVSQNHVGMVIPPENPQAFAKAVLQLQQQNDIAAQFGENGRHVAEEQFDRRTVLCRFIKRLENLPGSCRS
jgi:colanic acid biosynthesis glycosyl transferase WcaI